MQEYIYLCLDWVVDRSFLVKLFAENEPVRSKMASCFIAIVLAILSLTRAQGKSFFDLFRSLLNDGQINFILRVMCLLICEPLFGIISAVALFFSLFFP